MNSIWTALFLLKFKNSGSSESARKVKYQSLIERVVCQVDTTDDANGFQILVPSFTDTVKHERTPRAYKQFESVVQGYINDNYSVLT